MRLRIPSRRHDTGFFTRLVAGLRVCPAVGELRVNPATASVLITDSRGLVLEAVREHALSHGLFELPQGDRRALAASMVHGARRVDEGLRRLSGGEMDLRGLAFVVLLAGALYQLVRGELLAPAATLGWYAAAVLARSSGES